MPTAPRRGTGSKARQTYGRQRSFLDQNDGGIHCEGSPISEVQLSPSHLKRGNSDLCIHPPVKRSNSGSDSEAIRSSLSRSDSQHGLKETEESSEKKAALKASHELRETGQSHKFKDEIEYILDGIRTVDKPKIRRTSCIELTRSMLSQEFIEQVRAHQYISTVFEIICNDQDPVVSSCLALMIGIMLQDPRAWRDIVSINNLVAFLCSTLKLDTDPMSVTPNARQEMSMYNDFKDLTRLSGIIQKGQKVLTKSIVLSIMTCIINESFTLQDEHTLLIIDQEPDFLSTVIEILTEDLAWIKQPSSTADVSLQDVLDIGRIENCLRILERYALVSNRVAVTLSENVRLFPLLVQLITLCRAHVFQYPRCTDSLNLMLHTMRLLINVTNGYEPCCENLSQSGSIEVLIQNFIQFYGHCRNYNPEGIIATPSVTSSRIEIAREDSVLSDSRVTPQDKLETPDGGVKYSSLDGTTSRISSSSTVKIDNDANGWYDILLLSIGLLINMLETNSQRRHQVTSTAMSLDCKAIGDCFHRECSCEKSTEALERLVEIYNIEATISEMTENQVLAAYLALLIGCLVEGIPESESRLYCRISGQSLVPMLELLSEFAAFNQAVQAEHIGIEDDEDQVMLTQDLPPNISDNLHLEHSKPPTGISFMAAKATETHHSFLHVITVLQDIERRHYTLNKIEMN